MLLAAQADTEGWHGRLKNAHELTRRAMDSAEHNEAKETSASYQAAAALREAEAGNREQARTDANAALKLAQNRDVRVVTALTLAPSVLSTPGKSNYRTSPVCAGPFAGSRVHQAGGLRNNDRRYASDGQYVARSAKNLICT